jgi:lambda family phage portal protein
MFDRVAAMQWGATSAFKGADVTRLYSDRWQATNHPDTEVQYALRQLRASSRDLVRNNPYAAGAVNAIADNVIGWEGMQFRPHPPTLDGEITRPVRWAIETAWRDWCENYATVDGMESWFETERLISKTWATDGEVFIRRHRGFRNPYGYAVEVLDADLLDEDFNEKRDRTGREIVMGVEVDEYGRPLAYHFWPEHPDELGFRRERVRVPADQIAHHFVRYRPGQHRGFPLLTPALTTVEMIDGYTEAELVAARHHASTMGIITNNDPEAIAVWAARMATQGERGKGDFQRRVKFTPGTTHELAPGQGWQTHSPEHPNSAFDGFVKALMRGVARAAGMSYLTLTGDVGEANYSSMRAGLIPERDHWRAVQKVTARRVHRPIHDDWRAMARLSGRIPSVDYVPEFRGRRWQWVDPAKDLEAADGEIKLGHASRQEKAADRGRDFEQIVDESREDMEYARENGVYVGGVSTPAARRSTETPPNGNGNGNGASAHGSRLAPYTGAMPHE